MRIREYNDDKQTVFKVDGDFIGNITGNNVIVILMGDGSIFGNVSVNGGNVVLIKGSISGNVMAENLVCPNPKTENQKFIDKLSHIRGIKE